MVERFEREISWGVTRGGAISGRGCLSRVRSDVHAVNILADKKSTPKVGTTVHTMMEHTLTGKLGIHKVHENCRKLLGRRVVSVSTHSISSVVRHNNAILRATHYGAVHARRNRRGTTTVYGGCKVSKLMMVNKSNSFTKTRGLTGLNMGAVNVPKAVSLSVTYASCAVKFSATIGATVRTVSGIHSASASRREYDIVRIVKHSTKCLTL